MTEGANRKPVNEREDGQAVAQDDKHSPQNLRDVIASVLAFDIGASSGRAIVGRLDRRVSAAPKLTIEEVHRFPNDPVQVGGRLHWDILRLLHEVKQGIVQSVQDGQTPQSIGLDTWAVDFGLIGRDGELLGNPYHYRDGHTEGMIEEVSALLGKEVIFRSSGLQFLPFNTIYQLYAMQKNGSPLLEQAEALLMIPDLLIYFLTGERICEFTNASTTQLLHPLTKEWNREILAKLGVPDRFLLPVTEPGTKVGRLNEAVCRELSVPMLPVIAVGEHDTASAVVAVPAEAGRPFAYLSCGTWSLLGTELPHPVLSDEALAWNFTNEGGVNGTYRLLKNIMGLWLIQESKRAWDKAGHSHSFAELVKLAEQAEPFRSLIDPDDDRFMAPGDMPTRVQSYCRETGQPVPETIGAMARCIFESLALKYRIVLERTERLAGSTFGGLHMVGGGIQNELLCRFTANAIGRPVWAGPIEGSAIGNVAMQLIALGHIRDLEEARALIRSSFPIITYEPQEKGTWEEALRRFRGITGN